MYDPNMASVYPKEINGKTYYYLREMGRVDGKPKMVSEWTDIGFVDTV